LIPESITWLRRSVMPRHQVFASRLMSSENYA